MKGYLYYSSVEAERNREFINDLVKHAHKQDISLTLLVDEEQPDDDADFILFRDRKPELSATWETAGYRMINRSEVNRIANDKLKTFEMATLLGISAIPTWLIKNDNALNSYPLVLKTIDGHGGSEVFLCKSLEEASNVFSSLKGRRLIRQPFIESGSTDVRVFMIGDEILGAVKRIGHNSFKSNYTLGGSVEKYVLAGWQENEVRKIAKALKSDYIGIDFLLLPDGTWILNEIEDPVGARSLYVTHDFSVAEKLISYIKGLVEKK
ncbi:ATP-grasp domain-containing protein [Sporosarcina oncorhynchi]|uniref:ATP-grasp domain-containing protein n=1 Tax=Sporosarcina oncorhynchi TaxID=3056444 RepID=A0ABZ0LAU6_9BACL|nr:ATP-grasp domain-containing protein [Sporosarcina sp. T2O-4]WOV88714.1 ATP-grasp domain-containing protein [Sporosarcina sp. T2O-4]